VYDAVGANELARKDRDRVTVIINGVPLHAHANTKFDFMCMVNQPDFNQNMQQCDTILSHCSS